MENKGGAPVLCPQNILKGSYSRKNTRNWDGEGAERVSLQGSDSHQDSKNPFPNPPSSGFGRQGGSLLSFPAARGALATPSPHPHCHTPLTAASPGSGIAPGVWAGLNPWEKDSIYLQGLGLGTQNAQVPNLGKLRSHCCCSAPPLTAVGVGAQGSGDSSGSSLSQALKVGNRQGGGAVLFQPMVTHIPQSQIAPTMGS